MNPIRALRDVSGGLRRTLIDAVEAATNRSAQLGEIMAAKMTKK